MQERNENPGGAQQVVLRTDPDRLTVNRPAWCSNERQWQEYTESVVQLLGAHDAGVTAGRNAGTGDVVLTRMNAPSWATAHEEVDAAIRWTREVDVAIEPMQLGEVTDPQSIGIWASQSDELQVVDGFLRVVRGPVRMYVGDGDQQVTPQQAREVAREITAFVDAIETDGDGA